MQRWNAPLRSRLLALATQLTLSLGISQRSYHSALRERYQPVSEHLGVELFPSQQQISANFRRVLAGDSSGLYAVTPVGRTGRMLSVRAMLANPAIRSSLDLSSGRLIVCVTVDSFQLTKLRKLTLAAHRVLNFSGTRA